MEDSGLRYPVTIDPVAGQTAYLKASNMLIRTPALFKRESEKKTS